MNRRRRTGGPGDFAARLDRAGEFLAGGRAESAAGPLRLLVAVLRHQQVVSAATASSADLAEGADRRLAQGRFPLLDLDAAVSPIAEGLGPAVGAIRAPLVPEPLAAAGAEIAGRSTLERMGLVEAWLEDPAGVDPRAGFWVRVAAGPVLERARAAIATPSRDEWTGRACPACGGLPQASTIAEESGEFMGGSPRSLICGRCAGWWVFPRATCAWCGEDDPRKLTSFVVEGDTAARIDGCETCRAYIKTFDLRRPGGVHVVPLVDDVATVALDLWAQEQGLHRPQVSVAGV